MKPFSRSAFLEYEVRSSWLLDVLGNFLPASWGSYYFSWKVKRKYARYVKSVENFNLVYPEITGVAVVFQNQLCVLPRPNRHHDIYRKLNLPGTAYIDAVEGFVDAKGNFLTRLEAMKRAKITKQLNRRKGDQFYQGPELYSEDLW